jgi:hypothetical protein
MAEHKGHYNRKCRRQIGAGAARRNVTETPVIPGATQRVRAKRGPMTGSGANPKSSVALRPVSEFRIRRIHAVPE